MYTSGVIFLHRRITAGFRCRYRVAYEAERRGMQTAQLNDAEVNCP